MTTENDNIDETPPAAPSPATDTETPPDGDVKVDAAETPPVEPKKPNKVQERINQLTREKYEQKQENAELRERLDKLENAPKTPAESVITAPREEDFDDLPDYNAANAKFIGEAAAKAAHDTIIAANRVDAEEVAATQRRQEVKTKHEAFNVNLDAKRGNFEDFDEVAYGHNFMDGDLAEQIFEMEKGPEVAYHLGSHLDEAARIFALNPVQRARELTKLEFQVEALAPKKVSDAPAPITPLGNSETVEQDPDKMTADEWQQWEYNRVRAKQAAQ